MRLLPAALALLLLLVHAELWFGKGGVPHRMSLAAGLKAQQAENAQARARNEQLAAEVADLREGTAGCPRACSHDEAECGLDAWVASGAAGARAAARLDSLRRLLRSMRSEERTTS